MRPPPTDDHALSTMMIVYKAAGKPQLMAELYEEAVKVQPSQELYRQLFTVFMRCNDLVKQQQAAMKLNRCATWCAQLSVCRRSPCSVGRGASTAAAQPWKG